MKDTVFTMRAKRLFVVWGFRLRRLSLRLLPFALVLWLGVEWGKAIEDARIHNDCKFTNTFRIDYTGYACRIGRE